MILDLTFVAFKILLFIHNIKKKNSLSIDSLYWHNFLLTYLYELSPNKNSFTSYNLHIWKTNAFFIDETVSCRQSTEWKACYVRPSYPEWRVLKRILSESSRDKNTAFSKWQELIALPPLFFFSFSCSLEIISRQYLCQSSAPFIGSTLSRPRLT